MGENQELITTIKFVVKTFRFERWLYNITTIISFLIIFACTIALFYKGLENIPLILTMCGSTGVITFTCGRLLKMWNDIINFANNHFKS